VAENNALFGWDVIYAVMQFFRWYGSVGPQVEDFSCEEFSVSVIGDYVTEETKYH